MVESRREKMTPLYAGAFTGFAFLISTYLDHLGFVDLSGGGLLAWILILLMMLPFFVFVGAKGTTDFLSAIWEDEAERVSAVARASRRFWRFSGGLLLVFVPGAFVVFGLIA